MKCLALLGFSLMACGGGGPRIYRIVVDQTQLAGAVGSQGSLPATCYSASAQPPNQVVERSLRIKHIWILQDGVDGAQYIDLGALAANPGWSLGLASTGVGGPQTGPLTVSGPIEGKDRKFRTERVDLLGQTSSHPFVSRRTKSVQVDFKDLGQLASGTLSLSSIYSCESCPNPNTESAQNCEVALPFSGQMIDEQAMTIY